MNSNKEARALSVIVGERLRRFREEKSLRQEDIAEAAKRYGLPWGRSSVASLESGSRNLSIEELMVMSLIIAEFGGWHEAIIPADENILIGKERHIQSWGMLTNLEYLWQPRKRLTENRDVDEVMFLGSLPGPDRRGFEGDRIYAWHVLLNDRMAERIWPWVFGYHLGDSWTELLQKVAERLERPDGREVSQGLVTLIAFALWGRTLPEERDLRAEGRGPHESARALQAVRGHSTRELIAEVQAEINSKIDLIFECEEEVSRVAQNEQVLKLWIEKLEGRKRDALVAIFSRSSKNEPRVYGES
jgi:transcriptional regulator with XRE-family HTH domain